VLVEVGGIVAVAVASDVAVAVAARVRVGLGVEPPFFPSSSPPLHAARRTRIGRRVETETTG
jgi:hypothetical protein